MAKATLAIATALLVAMTALASAQGPSYERRGYGGPLYVGPNFQEGGQHSPPVYESGPSKKTYRKKSTGRSTKVRKAPAAKETDTAKSTPEKSSPEESASETSNVESENSSVSSGTVDEKKEPQAKSAASTGIDSENSSISATELATGTTSEKSTAENVTANEAQGNKNVGCKKYFPSAGLTLSVPCENR